MGLVGTLTTATVLVAGALVAGATTGATDAATNAPTAESAATVEFTTRGEHAYAVPEGVTRVDVIAVGGAGGASADRGGGRAGRIVGTLDVTPGQTLYAVVASNASGTTPGANGGGAAGGSAAECAGTPGAGGGATDVRTVPIGQSGSAESRVLVAGGGGGAAVLGTSGGDEYQLYGGHRGHGGGGAAVGGFAGHLGDGGQGGGGGENDGTSTTGGRGGVGTAGQGNGCGGGGGGGYGGGGGGAAGPAGGMGGGGGGGGSLVPEGFPAGMADHGDTPSVNFSTPGTPAATGPLEITNTATLKQNDQGGGPVDFTNCPSSCKWIDGGTSGPAPGGLGYDFGYASTQAWGAASLILPDFSQSFVSVRPAPEDSPADIDQPFLLADFAHYNNPIRGDSPTNLAIQTLVTVQAPSGAPAEFSLRGPQSIPLSFLETDNKPPCDPAFQESSTPCDDVWTVNEFTRTVTAGGVTWHFEVLGWRTPEGEFERRFITEERHVSQRDLYAKVTVDTNPTTSVLTLDETTPSAPVLNMTTTPVPQTGGTATFTDGDSPIEGCTDVPVGTDDGVTTCTPDDLSPGTHTFAARFSGGIGYASSEADPVEYSGAQPETTTTLTATPNPADLNEAVTLTATVATSGSGAAPTGEVAFHVDDAEAPLAKAQLEDGKASAVVILPGGDHTATAEYSGDDTYLPSTSEPATDVSVTCTQTISGEYKKPLRVTSGTTCVKPGARIENSITVARGASLNLEGASVRGTVVAAKPRAIRICDSSAKMISVSQASEFVLIGDPDHGCAPNTANGVLLAIQNRGGLVIVDNTVGAVLALGNRGAGPLPGQDTPVVRGNHRP
jgi:hypothetical protein